ncbi:MULTISPECIES: acyl carrier protein [unclassified Streptomyces]|uniref:acyl carrier protein n=1 Tax=unclassified Streptomyces TaxID=2593676 RepID=UPI002258C8E5|nr:MULTISPECIES: acyl carrier protein [unclassified Streptomyces]MCX4626888.1 phosphopantetheine-binding protein [Streptomyces sp. NBC_01443]WSW43052.1 phosphopantetheine-binding protein [Streptomyces sp. NBC_01001]
MTMTANETANLTTQLTGAALTELVVSIYRETLGVADLDEQSDFYEWGGDSLTAFRITARLEEALGAEVPVALVFAYPSPADLADVVHADFVQA